MTHEKKDVIAPNDEKAVKAMDIVRQQEAKKQLAAREAVMAAGFDLKEYDLFTYIQMGRNVFQLHEMAGLMGGKILPAVKENGQQGPFLKAMEETGIHPRKAQRYMRAARRFGKYDKLPHLPNSKPAIMEELTDPELEKLNEGEEVKGLTLDAAGRMTAAQSRDALRTAEKKIAKQKEAHKKEAGKLHEITGGLKIRAGDPVQLTPAQKAHRLLRGTFTPEYTLALAKISSGIREAMPIPAGAERIQGIGVQELNERLNQFSPGMQTFHDLVQTWMDETDNAGPIGDWQISGLPDAGVSADVPDLG